MQYLIITVAPLKYSKTLCYTAEEKDLYLKTVVNNYLENKELSQRNKLEMLDIITGSIHCYCLDELKMEEAKCSSEEAFPSADIFIDESEYGINS